MIDPTHETYLFLAKEITLNPYHRLNGYDELKERFPDHTVHHEALIHNLLVSENYDFILVLGLVLKLNQNMQESMEEWLIK